MARPGGERWTPQGKDGGERPYSTYGRDRSRRSAERARAEGFRERIEMGGFQGVFAPCASAFAKAGPPTTPPSLNSAVCPGEVVDALLRTLEEEPGAVDVGGWREVRASSAWGRAVGAALASPLGVGNPHIWRPPRADDGRRDVDTVPLGCFPVRALEAVGGWSEQLVANEDFELNHRLLQDGGRVVFDPAIHSVHKPRESFGAVIRQYWRYGRAKGMVLAAAPESIRLRQLAPLALLTTVAMTPFARVARAALGVYVSLICFATIRAKGGWRMAPILAAMHLTWGTGVGVALARAAQQRLRRPPRPTDS